MFAFERRGQASTQRPCETSLLRCFRNATLADTVRQSPIMYPLILTNRMRPRFPARALVRPLFPSRSRLRSCWIAPFIAVLTVFGGPPPAFCQPQQPPAAGTSDTEADIRYTAHFASESGVSAYVPERWAALRVSLSNGGTASREVTCSTYFDEDANLQYGRRIWLPPQSLLRIDHPILLPKFDRSRGQYLDVHSLVFDAAARRETLIKSEGGRLRHDGTLIVTHDSRNTAIIGPRRQDTRRDPDPPLRQLADPLHEPADPLLDAVNLLAACRVASGFSNITFRIQDDFLPADEVYLDTLDHIVVADSRLSEDQAATAALRRWLHAGGHLWVMLDRVDPAVLEWLLGDAFTGYVVDRVPLNSVRIDEVPALTAATATVSETVEFDDPVDLVRVAGGNLNVTHRVNGWPAAMTMPYGDGQVLITTLGARGWMRTRPASAPPQTDPLMQSTYEALPPTVNLANEFLRLREAELLPAGELEGQVQEYIGHSIPPWWLIVGTLLGFSAVIVLIGAWLMSRGQLQRLGWTGSVLALGVSGFLIQTGRTNRRAVPPTIASIQMLQTIRGTDDLRSKGLISVYLPEGGEFPIAAMHGGQLLPDMSGLEQHLHRLVTTDLGVNHWENLRQPAGVRSTAFERSASSADRLAAYVTFDSQGVSGQCLGGPTGSDAVLVTRDGRLGLTLNSDGTFYGRGEDVFENDQYLGAALLSDEQDRRRRTFISVLENPKRRDYPALPQLMYWSGPIDDGFRLNEELKSQGASLIAVPLVIERPVNGTQIMIPSPFLSYVNRRNPDGTQSSAMWDPLRHEWQERTAPALGWLSFQVPRELLPLAVERARIDLKVSGPIGQVEILGLKEGNVIGLQKVKNPVGSLSIDIADSDALVIDGEGRLALGLDAGDRDRLPAAPDRIQNAKANFWRIESLALQLWAQTTEPATKD